MPWSCRLCGVLMAANVGKAQDEGGKLRIIVFGAHPDDCELDAGGTAARWAKLGHKVKFVSVTNGDIGHHEMAGGPLARRRAAEVERCAEILGIETEVLDNHDGELMPTLENRRRSSARSASWKADLVISHRPNDYHPDHRYTGILVQDAAFMVIVPNFCPDVPRSAQEPGLPVLRGLLPEAQPVRARRRRADRRGARPEGRRASTPWRRSSTSGTPGSSATSTRSRTAPRPDWGSLDAKDGSQRYGDVADRFRERWPRNWARGRGGKGRRPPRRSSSASTAHRSPREFPHRSW